MLPYYDKEKGIEGFQYAISFSGYYATQLISSLYFGSVSDRIGRRNTLLVSLLGLTICNILCFMSSSIPLFLVWRTVSGIFDCVISISQAYVTDITQPGEVSAYLSKLEAVMNAGQCLGPFIAGILSSYSLYYSIWFGIGCEAFAFIYAIINLPESVESVLEKRKLMKTFNMVRNANKNALNSGLLEEANREVEQIQRQFMNSLKIEEKERMKNAKLEVNYLIVITIICEFCNKFIFSSFDTIVSLYGTDKHQLSAQEFSFMSVLGSIINIFQTGCLFQYLVYKKGLSMPSIGSIAGLVSVASCLLLIYGNKMIYYAGGVLIIVAYGFYSPVAPSILSAESSEETHGKALSLIQIGGQSAYILSPFLFEQLYKESQNLPFYIDLVPSIILFIVMFMCSLLPGGKTAGQVALNAAMENDMKESVLNHDNELETEYLGRNTEMQNSKDQKAISYARGTNSPYLSNTALYTLPTPPADSGTGRFRDSSNGEDGGNNGGTLSI